MNICRTQTQPAAVNYWEPLRRSTSHTHILFCVVLLVCAAVYRPVDQELNISRIANVKEWYPNLAEVARLDENEPLLFMHEVYRAKIVWTVIFNGVVGEVRA